MQKSQEKETTPKTRPIPPDVRDVLRNVVEPLLARLQPTHTVSQLKLSEILLFAVSYYQDQLAKYGGVYHCHPDARLSGLYIPRTEDVLMAQLDRAQRTIEHMKAGLDGMLKPYYTYRPILATPPEDESSKEKN